MNTPSSPPPPTPAMRLALAQQRLAQAIERAEYHGWSGSSSRQYSAAVAEARAARVAVMSAWVSAWMSAWRRRWLLDQLEGVADRLMRPYCEWRWRRNREVVCVTRFCYRMIGEEFVLHCPKHGPRVE